MRADGIVRGQRVEQAKAQRARDLRRAMTLDERTLWRCLRNDGLSGLHFRRQQIIDGFIADFYCHAAGLVVELDGSAHDSRTEYDAERDRVLRARGLRVLRIASRDVRQALPDVLARVAGEAQPRLGSCG